MLNLPARDGFWFLALIRSVDDCRAPVLKGGVEQPLEAKGLSRQHEIKASHYGVIFRAGLWAASNLKAPEIVFYGIQVSGSGHVAYLSTMCVPRR